jgi:hypothetical protein
MLRLKWNVWLWMISGLVDELNRTIINFQAEVVHHSILVILTCFDVELITDDKLENRNILAELLKVNTLV